jgi:hypothetical protein
MLVAILCLVLGYIAVLQVASSNSIGSDKLSSELGHALAKRQSIVSTEVFTGFQQTITGTTITWQPTTYTWPSTTHTYDASTQTITGTIESDPGSTKYIYATLVTQADGSVVTERYELSTSLGSTVTVFLPGATTSAAYLDTSAATAQNIQSSLPAAAMPLDPTPSVSGLLTHGTSSSETSKQASITSSAGPSSTVAPILALPDAEKIVKGDYSTARYYVATYLPSFLVIILKILWSQVFASSKLMEPFRRLSDRSGTPASASLLTDYLSSSLSASSVVGLLGSRSLTTLLATFSVACTLVLAPLASESMSIRGSAKCVADDGTSRTCAPVWELNMTCIRVLQALLALLFVLILGYTLLSLRRRTTGVHRDPSSIVAIADMATDPAFVAELSASIQSASGHSQDYEIVKLNNFQHPYSYQHTRSSTEEPASFAQRHRTVLIHDIPLLILILLILSFVLTYALDYRSDSFNRFFNSNTFGPRFVLSSLATLLDNRFKRLEREVRILTPWRALRSLSREDRSLATKDDVGNKHSAEMTTSRGLPLTCYTSFPMAVWRNELFLAAVSIVAVLGDVLIIAVVGVPFSDAEIYEAYQASVWLSVAILGLMAVVSLAVMVFWRRGCRGIARDRPMPDTVLEVARRVVEAELGERRGEDHAALLHVNEGSGLVCS